MKEKNGKPSEKRGKPNTLARKKSGILIEVKTNLETADVREHIKQLEEYRQIANARGDKRRFVGAVAGAVVAKDAIKFAHETECT